MLCRLDVRGLLFMTGVSGEPNMSKVNSELFIVKAVATSFSGAVSSGTQKDEKCKYWYFFFKTLQMLFGLMYSFFKH